MFDLTGKDRHPPWGMALEISIQLPIWWGKGSSCNKLAGYHTSRRLTRWSSGWMVTPPYHWLSDILSDHFWSPVEKSFRRFGQIRLGKLRMTGVFSTQECLGCANLCCFYPAFLDCIHALFVKINISHVSICIFLPTSTVLSIMLLYCVWCTLSVYSLVCSYGFHWFYPWHRRLLKALRSAVGAGAHVILRLPSGDASQARPAPSVAPPPGENQGGCEPIWSMASRINWESDESALANQWWWFLAGPLIAIEHESDVILGMVTCNDGHQPSSNKDVAMVDSVVDVVATSSMWSQPIMIPASRGQAQCAVWGLASSRCIVYYRRA